MSKPHRRRADPLTAATELKIVGGRFRGRRLCHEPYRTGEDELVTRPMKHRLRESIFNLVGTEVAGLHAIDLFAGTGALGLEAISRGAVHGTFIERHVPTARVIEENIASLAAEDQSTLLVTSAFLWGKRLANEQASPQSEIQNPKSKIADAPWLVFCSPPYAFFVDRQAEMLELIASVRRAAPGGSILIVEADDRFDFALLAADGDEPAWDVRPYSPAVVGVWRKASSA